MLTLQPILHILREHKPELQLKYPISRLGVFGSYARGDANEKSDIDIAVDIDGPMGLNFIAMADEIENLLGKKTDVVPKRSIKPQYLAYVKKILYMSERKPSLLIEDILNCIERILSYSKAFLLMSFPAIMEVEACLYNFQVIGEAVTKLPEYIKEFQYANSMVVN